MSTFYCKVDYGTTAKNKYHQAIYTLLRSCDGLLVYDAEQFRKDITKNINAVWDLYPRCKPIEPSWNQQGKHWYLHLRNTDFRVECLLWRVEKHQYE